MLDVDNVAPAKREAYLRDGALNAIWRAHSAEMTVRALGEALADAANGLSSEKLAMRRNFLELSRRFMEVERDKQLLRALAELIAWANERDHHVQEQEKERQADIQAASVSS